MTYRSSGEPPAQTSTMTDVCCGKRRGDRPRPGECPFWNHLNIVVSVLWQRVQAGQAARVHPGPARALVRARLYGEPTRPACRISNPVASRGPAPPDPACLCGNGPRGLRTALVRCSPWPALRVARSAISLATVSGCPACPLPDQGSYHGWFEIGFLALQKPRLRSPSNLPPRYQSPPPLTAYL